MQNRDASDTQTTDRPRSRRLDSFRNKDLPALESFVSIVCSSPPSIHAVWEAVVFNDRLISVNQQ